MNFSRLSIFALLLFLVAMSTALSSTDLNGDGYYTRLVEWQDVLSSQEYVQGEVIVEFDDARTLSSLDAETLDGLDLTDMFQYRPVGVFEILSEESVAEILTRLEGRAGIRNVYPNLIRRCAYVPNDPSYNRQEYMAPIDSEGAWDVTTGSAFINVAVIDTGMDVEHPEFTGKVIWQENFKDPEIQGAGNVFDDSGHGTGTAGIIGAWGNNGIGIAGMGWDIRLLAFRACGGSDLTCTIADEVKAIDSAVAHGAHVINLSLGGKGTNTLEAQAIKSAYNAGVIIVAASGNEDPGQYYQATGDPAIDADELYYPAGFSEVIGVAALSNTSTGGPITDPALLTRAEFSNYGEAIVTVAAVGTRVYTTTPFRLKSEVEYAIYATRNYSRLNGTSFACPQVAGAAALLLSNNPGLTPQEVITLIQEGAMPMGGPDLNGNGVDDYMGYGILNVAASIGNEGSGGGVFESAELLAGIVPSPLFANDIFVLVRCKIGCDTPPLVTYIVESTFENGIIGMEPLPAHAGSFLGKFSPEGSGTIVVKILGESGGLPFPQLECEFIHIN